VSKQSRNNSLFQTRRAAQALAIALPRLETVIITLLTVLVLCLLSTPAHSEDSTLPIASGDDDSTATSTLPPTGCDPEYYDSLEARAWLEAQREITQNQNLIFKPDSVLEYTCFDKFVGELAHSGLFSESGRWGSGLGGDSLDKALDKTVMEPLFTYYTNNFPHAFLGGRLGYSYNMASRGSGLSGYFCDTMNKIWQQAKCMNFVDNETNDGFFTFEQYRDGADKRALPTQCSGDLSEKYIQAINTAWADVPWEKDPVVMFYDDIDHSDCSQSPVISTGVKVVRPTAEVPEHEEKYCVMQGCVYVPSDKTTGACEPSATYEDDEDEDED